MDGPACARGHGPSKGTETGRSQPGMQGPAHVTAGKKWESSVVWKSMGLIVSVAGLNQSDACPAVLQRRSRKDRRRRDARTGGAAGDRELTAARKGVEQRVWRTSIKRCHLCTYWLTFIWTLVAFVMKTVFVCVYKKMSNIILGTRHEIIFSSFKN